MLSEASQSTAGVLLLTILGIEYGGFFMLKIVRGRHPVTEFQRSFARAGHAHAGVLVTLALATQVLVDGAEMSGVGAGLARSGIAGAAALMSAGFFLSSIGPGRTSPNGFVVLLYAGVVSLGLGAASLGIGLLTA